ncbi:fatty acid desaturase [Rufibacter radiotolerans]|uniref:Fatty acid desaturase n=1 Tax=Rufibacter radiotolerans TaxID=1379910 RepID=A0A0H4VMJ6_9BACT|nr:acyl-CoA desaturase [Rufibacter radiotolerans]AKQ44989.1 fatty acid desaturase [Rufibacter radiotolerans]
MATPKFIAPSTSFYAELKSRTSAYFEEIGSQPTGNKNLYIKAAVLLSSLVFLYVHLVFFTPPFWLAIIECILLGGVTAAIGFNIMHDGGHGSFSKRKWVNTLAGLSSNMLGANIHMWTTKHNIIHHTYTNIDGVDDDLDAKPFLRLCENQEHLKIHKYQHFYFWGAYAMLFIYWVFITDYIKYFTQKVGTIPLQKMKRKDHISFWGFKMMHFALFVILPIYTVGFLPWLIGFLIYGMFTGLVMSIVFQLAHTVEHAHFPMPTVATNRIEDEWALHQLKTTANFATKNKIVSWLTGGLNFQIEHHLFPRISHVHYPAISKIIKQACAEFGVTYNEYPKTRTAILSHIAHLKQLALQPVLVQR